MQSRRLREVVYRKTRRHDLVFLICIVETLRNEITKSLKCLVSESSCSHPSSSIFRCLCGVCSSPSNGTFEDSSVGSNEASKTSRRERERKEREQRVAQSERIPTCIFSSKIDGYLICVVRLSYLSKLRVVLETCFLPIGRVLFVCRFVVVRSNDERYTRSKVTRPRVR